MKQVLQDLRTGATRIEEVPCPMVPDGHLLIRTRQTLVSAGTEKMLVDFGRSNLLDKARQQPDKVRAVLDKIRTDGLMPTLDAVRAKLDQPISMGYCNVGTVIQCGKGVEDFKPGDRVASNGHHAEMVVVPKHLCAHIPPSVSDDQASFTVLGAIALQGIRLIKPELGETVVVMGLGLIGLLTVQLLRANGCRVLGVDFIAERASMARQYGAEAIVLREGVDPVPFALAMTNGVGVDAVLVTASTRSNDPMHQAATMCRKRGRIVLVGVVGLTLSRADFYEKELNFQVSCSYGPGRYDPDYEQQGRDYPLPYVRWTEQRNFEAVLAAMAAGTVKPDDLISQRYPLEQAGQAYAQLLQADALGVVLECDVQRPTADLTPRSVAIPVAVSAPVADIRVGFIGSGNYATRVLIPAFSKAGAQLGSIACKSGVSGVHAARKYGFATVSTDADSLLQDTAITVAVIATRHDTHARFTAQALHSGKHVFVEKPLAISQAELLLVEQAFAQSRQLANPPQLMIGFNRRFSPLVQGIKKAIDTSLAPACINIMVNAGAIPPSSWIQDRAVGGGRIIGEACHFVDLALFLAGDSIVDYSIMGAAADQCVIQLRFANGSIASIQYLSNGHATFPKERVEVIWRGGIYQVDNFRKLRVFGGAAPARALWRQDKGNNACVQAFLDCLRKGDPAPIGFDDILQVSRCVIDLADRLEQS